MSGRPFRRLNRKSMDIWELLLVAQIFLLRFKSQRGFTAYLLIFQNWFLHFRIFVSFQMELFRNAHFAIFSAKSAETSVTSWRTRSCKEKWNTLFPCQSVPCVWQSLVFSLIFGVNSGGKRRTFLHHYFKEVKPIRGWRKSVCLWH